MEEDRRFLTRRTGIIRQLTNPIYRQNIKYLASDVSRRCLVATVWSLPPPEIKYDPGNTPASGLKISGINWSRTELDEDLNTFRLKFT